MSFTASLEEIVRANHSGLLGKKPHWDRQPLGSVVRILNGYPFESSRFVKANGASDARPRLLRIRDIVRGFSDTIYDGPFDPAYVVNRGEIVVGMDGDFNLAAWPGEPVLLNQRTCKLVPDQDRCLASYLGIVLPGYLKAINDHTPSITVKHLSSRTIAEIPLPLPPLEEQQELVSEIETQFSRLDAAVAALKRAQANLKRYRASVLKAACEGRLVPTEAELARHEGRSYETGAELLARVLEERRRSWNGRGRYVEPAGPETVGLAELPEGWASATLEQLTSAARPICYGILMPKDNVPDGVLFVKVKDLKGDRVNLDGLHRTAHAIAAKYARASLRAGDLLLAIRGTFGRVAEVPAELDGGNITQDTARLAVPTLLCRRYVAQALRSEGIQNYFKRVARGVAVKGVNIGDVRPCLVPLPPQAEQERIVGEVERRLSAVEAAENAVEAGLRRAARLRQAVLARAFGLNSDLSD